MDDRAVRLPENRVDLPLTRLGVKYLIVEAKGPGSLDGRASIDRARDQARLYAEKYQLPARCFAYAGHPQRPATWKLPCLRRDGTVDERRLPKAIRRCSATTVASRYACQNHSSPACSHALPRPQPARAGCPIKTRPQLRSTRPCRTR